MLYAIVLRCLFAACVNSKLFGFNFAKHNANYGLFFFERACACMCVCVCVCVCVKLGKVSTAVKTDNRGRFYAIGSDIGNGKRKFVKAKKDFNIP